MRHRFLLVAAAFLATASAEPAGSSYAGPITAVGTEPFWRLVIDPASNTMWLHELEGSGYPVSPYASPVVGTDGSATFKAADFTVRLTMAEGCSDGMSDLSFPMAAIVTAGSHTYRGCAYQRWDNELISLLPQIDACLAAAKSKGPVSLAARTNAGTIVRLLADEGVFECAFRLDSVEPGSAGVLTDAVPMVSERDPLFFRAPGENPGGECFEAPEVRAADGSLVGWTMADEDC